MARHMDLGRSFLPAGSLVLAMISFTLGASFSKRLFPLVGPEGATALRLVIGAFVLALVFRPWRTRLSEVAWRAVTVYGLAMAGTNLFFYLAIRTLPLGVAIALEFTGPLTVAVLASRRSLDFLWILCAAVGLLLLLPLTKETPHLDLGGVGMALGAGVCWAIYIVAGKKAGLENGAVATSLGMSVGAVAILPIGLLHSGALLFQPGILATGLVVAILSSAIPYSLEMVALRRLPAQTYGTLASCEPAIGALAGLIFLGEALAPLQCCAIGIVITASVGATVTAMGARQTEGVGVLAG